METQFFHIFEELFHTNTAEMGTVIVNLLSNVFSLCVTVFLVVVKWFLFQKANEPGWASLIPFYNQYMLFKIAGKKKLFWIVLPLWIICGIAWVLAAVAAIGMFVGLFVAIGGVTDVLTDSAILFFAALAVTLLSAAAVWVLTIFRAIGLAKNFQAGGGFAVGIIFVPIVFLAILAFGKSYQYCGEGRRMGQPGAAQFPYGRFDGGTQ